MVNISKIGIGLIKVARPVHWIKNLALFAALVFKGGLFDQDLFIVVLSAFFSFSFAASACYIINDTLDRKRDRAHPIKKGRPIASGVVSVPLALFFAVGLLAVSLFWANVISHLYFLLLLSYVILQILYSLFLKHLHVIDIIVIAAGFMIRVYSGAIVINAHLSVWFLLCVLSVSLFLASGKRRAELGVEGASSGKTRTSLKKYTKELLDSYVTMFGNATWMSWALFTFFESPRVSTEVWLILAEISKTASINKLLMITIPVAIFGIMRYQSLIFEERSEAPEKLFLTDVALVFSALLWFGLVVIILYGGVATTF